MAAAARHRHATPTRRPSPTTTTGGDGTAFAGGGGGRPRPPDEDSPPGRDHRNDDNCRRMRTLVIIEDERPSCVRGEHSAAGGGDATPPARPICRDGPAAAPSAAARARAGCATSPPMPMPTASSPEVNPAEQDRRHRRATTTTTRRRIWECDRRIEIAGQPVRSSGFPDSAPTPSPPTATVAPATTIRRGQDALLLLLLQQLLGRWRRRRQWRIPEQSATAAECRLETRTSKSWG